MGQQRGFRFLVGVACLGSTLVLGGCGAAPEGEISAEEAGQELAGDACTVHYSHSSWDKDGNRGLMATVVITNNSAPTVNGWTLKWSFQSGETIVNAWNATVTQAGSAASARNTSWNKVIPTGGRADFGYIATFVTSPPVTPKFFSLNGKTCKVVR
jgi:cellulase/cellobiase CelA1